jgi:hypothetical protein
MEASSTIGRTKHCLLLDAPETIVMFLQHEVKCLAGSYDVPTVVLSPLELVALWDLKRDIYHYLLTHRFSLKRRFQWYTIHYFVIIGPSFVKSG